MKYKIVKPPIISETKCPIVLTRYLYIKEEVMISLMISILEKNRDEALFWAYELYWSGFQEKVFDYLMSVFAELFEPLHPRLRKFLEKQLEAWRKDPRNHCILGTIVRNLADQSRKFYIDPFVLKTQSVLDPTVKDHRFYIELEDKDVKQYETIVLNEGELPRLTLGKACRFSTQKQYNQIFGTAHKDTSDEDIRYASMMKWEYYSSFSPIWKERIKIFNGHTDQVSKKVMFKDDDDEEGFYDLYGYEPDEQSPDILSKITHMNPVVQMSLHDFCIKFNAAKDTVDKMRKDEDLTEMITSIERMTI